MLKRGVMDSGWWMKERCLNPRLDYFDWWVCIEDFTNCVDGYVGMYFLQYRSMQWICWNAMVLFICEFGYVVMRGAANAWCC